MDINERPDIIYNKSLKDLICSCLDYVRYESLIDSFTHDRAINAVFQLFRDNVSYEMFISQIKHNCSVELERSKIWL